MVRTYTIDRTLLITLFFLFTLSGKSQNYVGIAGGGGLTSNVGFRVALVNELPINSFLSIQSETAFIQRANWEIIQRLEEEKDYRQVMISYVELPVMSKLELNLNAVRLHALLGIKVGYGVDMRANFVDDGIINVEKLSFNEVAINRFDLGLSLGVGLNRVISKNRKIFIDYRYYLGLNNIDKSPESEIYNEGSVVNMGFLIPIGKKGGKIEK